MTPTHWPHAPLHRFDESGAFIVTGGTYRKEHFLDNDAKLDLAQDTLFAVAEEFGWQLQAWAILPNHYHFVAVAPEDSTTLRSLVGKLHMLTAKAFNRMDGTPGRQVWYQYWDSRITYERSYLARLQYVHTNPMHHGVVRVATEYRWCSAGWFERTAERSLRETVASFKTDRVNVMDSF